MIERLVDFSIRNRALVIFGVLLMGAVGLRSAQQLPIDAVPDVTNVQVQVLTTAPALGPLEVEKFITFPVETVMSGLPRLAELRSLSKFGLSSVTIVFKWMSILDRFHSGMFHWRIVPLLNPDGLLRKRMEELGKPYEWMLKEKEAHGFYRPENRLELYERMLAFFDKYIGPGKTAPQETAQLD